MTSNHLPQQQNTNKAKSQLATSTSTTNPNSQSSTVLLFSIEQWELCRRLKNSGITKSQLCQAFDDLEKMDRDLGNLYNLPINTLIPTTSSSSSSSSSPASSTLIKTENKNINFKLSVDLNGVDITSSNATTVVNNYFSSFISQEMENRELEEFRNKGEVVIHSEISFFVYKHDLKQSQIARMASVNQAYVSKFLRGDFFDLSDNAKTLLYKWYLRFTKCPSVYLQAHNITLTATNNPQGLNLNADLKLNGKLDYPSFTNVTNAPTDSKRTRFSFKPEHITILEKSFIENQYPDQKKREELARICNEARRCSDREKVNEQVITHWFQNKRKMIRKSNSEDQSLKSPNDAKNISSNNNDINASLNNLDYQNQSPINFQDLIEDDE